ncbi:hypothetical protein JCM5353_002829 [Sporobolomyces roseus]
MKNQLPSAASTSSKLPKNTVLTEAGRSPWYGKDGKPVPAYIIGIGGGSASGKTRVAQEVLKSLGVPWVLVISQDNFYKSLTAKEKEAAFRSEHDFDSPNSFDYDVLTQCIQDLKDCKAVQIPNYSFVKHSRLDETTYLYGAAIVIVEGIFVLHDEALRNVLDLKVFVQCDSDLMLARRLRRDLVERGRQADGVLDQYLRFVKPSFDSFIAPTARYADIIVPGMNNERSIDLIASHIDRKLKDRKMELRGELFKETTDQQSRSRTGTIVDRMGTYSQPGTPGMEKSEADAGLKHLKEEVGADADDGVPDTVHVMKETSQLRGIHTLLRSTETSAEDWLFFANRLSTLVAEHALSLLPYQPKSVDTRSGSTYNGQELSMPSDRLCGVSILRSGGSLEKGLRRVVRDIALGSVLIQSDASTGEPFLYSVNLPACLTTSSQSAAESHVLLLDSQIGTGAAALMAVRILLDHGVKEEKIIICCILISKVGGVWALRRAFPKVKVACSAADPGLEERVEQTHDGKKKKIFTILPGLGSFGDRYFLNV